MLVPSDNEIEQLSKLTGFLLVAAYKEDLHLPEIRFGITSQAICKINLFYKDLNNEPKQILEAFSLAELEGMLKNHSTFTAYFLDQTVRKVL